MAVPDKPLQLKFDPDNLTLGEVKILDEYSVSGFRAFMLKYGNWTPEEIDGLTRREWRELMGDFYKAFAEAAAPKATGTP